MSKISKTKSQSKKSPVPGYKFIKEAAGIEEYELTSNGLRVLYQERPNTGIVTSNITYLVGAVDEEKGESGLAHMLEHMLFKPTTFDKEAKIQEGGAMRFERETGCILNANTWRDRTTYYFSYPVEHLNRALGIEAERMTGVILNDKELTPEQNNVLSEFDMYNGDPHFALAVQMTSTAFHSHPYGHETIGYREDIEDYNPTKLERFYRNYYRPDNATMMVIGDIDRKGALDAVKKHFGKIKRYTGKIPRNTAREPVQEGLRRVEIVRPATTQIASIGFKHDGYGTDEWFSAYLLLEVLTGGPESILQKKLIDTGKVSSLNTMLEPTKETNLATLSATLPPGQTQADIEKEILDTVRSLSVKEISSLVEKTKARLLTDELFAREDSMKVCSELTEYVAAGDWTLYEKMIDQLNRLTAKDVADTASRLFDEKNLTIGYFIGK
tara:strand:- start:626 stop:1948 length:1323 start_codon:yes stop_codon:yes gene_type:complete